MFGEHEYAVGNGADVLNEVNLYRLYDAQMRQIDYEQHGEAMTSFIPVYPGLRRAAAAR